jgi:hypothetical protein
MKWVLMDLVVMYIVACADGIDSHTKGQRIVRALCWPVTLTNWFRFQPHQLHRLLNILWTVLIAGWFFSLLVDRL